MGGGNSGRGPFPSSARSGAFAILLCQARASQWKALAKMVKRLTAIHIHDQISSRPVRSPCDFSGTPSLFNIDNKRFEAGV